MTADTVVYVTVFPPAALADDELEDDDLEDDELEDELDVVVCPLLASVKYPLGSKTYSRGRSDRGSGCACYGGGGSTWQRSRDGDHVGRIA